ncbi:MAG: hypothetical protein P8N43_09130 [Alphaproteobacteria bacterium]|jgi:hypothetical protein|nr:hypothetical protein [Alphaproteobacteria bacterium]
MIEPSAFNAHTSVSALLIANRSEAPETGRPRKSNDQTKLDVPPQLSGSDNFRIASRTEISNFALDLTDVGSGRDDIGNALSGTFEELLEIFHGRGNAGAALETALESVSALIETAAGDSDVVGVQLGVASVIRNFGAENGDGAVFGSVTGFAIEVGLVRGEHVSAQDVQLVGLGGEKVDLSVEQRRTGIVDGLYRIQDKVPFGEELETLRSENKAQVEALRNALDRLRLVQNALSDYRNGDTRALEEVEKFFRSGTLDAGAVRAISDVRGTSQTVFPGVGVLSLE